MGRHRPSNRDDFDKVKDALHKLKSENNKLRKKNSALRKELKKVEDSALDENLEVEVVADIIKVEPEKHKCNKCKSGSFTKVSAGKYDIVVCVDCGFKKRVLK